MAKSYTDYLDEQARKEARKVFFRNLFTRNRSASARNSRSVTLATLQINAFVVGIIALAALATNPQIFGEPDHFRVHSGIKPIVREVVAEEMKPAPATITLLAPNLQSADTSENPGLNGSAVADIESNDSLNIPDVAPPISTIDPEPIPTITESDNNEIAEEPPASKRDITITKFNHPLSGEQVAEQRYLEALELINHGRTDEAEKKLRLAIHMFSKHAKTTELLIGLLIEQNRQNEAIEVLESALERAQNMANWERWLVKLYIDTGRTDKAIERTKRLLSQMLDTDNLNLLAGLYQQLGNLEDSKNIYLSALSLDGYEYKTWLGLALVYEKLNELKQAKNAYSNARNLNTNWEINSFIGSRLRAIDLRSNS